MDNLNKTISFVLGLVVVLVFFAVISGRLNLKGKLPFFSSATTPTPTKSAITTPTPGSVKTGTGSTSTYGSYSQTNGKTPSSIPSTGSPTLLLPILLSGLGGGLMLRRTKKG